MTTPNTEKSMYCQVCQFACDHLRPDVGPSRYVHTEAVLLHHRRLRVVDHEPVPVPIETLAAPIQLCDFDIEIPAVFIYVSGDRVTVDKRVTARYVSAGDHQRQNVAARTLRVETEKMMTSNWGTRWAACEGCAALIEAGDILGLLRRSVDRLPAKHTNTQKKLIGVRSRINEQFEDFFSTRLPARLRIIDGHPLGVADNTDGPTGDLI